MQQAVRREGAARRACDVGDFMAGCRGDGAIAGAATGAIAFEGLGTREVFIVTSGGRYDMVNDVSF